MTAQTVGFQNRHPLLKNAFIYLFMGVLGLHRCSGFSLVAARRGDSLFVVCGFLIAVVSLAMSTGSRAPGLYQMWHVDSAAAAPGFESTSTWVWLLQNMWDLSVSRMESVSPALAGGFFTTEPPGKPDIHFQIIKRCTWRTIAQVQCCFCVGIEKTSRDPQPCWFSKCGPQSFSLDSRVPQSSGPYSELLRISESRAQESVFFVCLSDFENH